MIKVIQVVDSVLTRVVNIALITLFSVMMSLAFVQVCLRYFFNNSILWGDTASRTLVIWVGFLGAVIATGENKHFHIDVLTRFLKKRHQTRSEEHTSELQSPCNLVCRLLLEKKKKTQTVTM